MAGHLLSGGAEPPRKDGRKTPAKAAAALVATQASFCVGAVLLRASLAGDGKDREYEPAVFGFFRESLSGALLLFYTYGLRADSPLPHREDLGLFVALGACNAANHFFYILGVQQAGVLVAGCMQPAIGVYTIAFATALGLEPLTARKSIGVLMAAVGAMTMVGVFDGKAGGEVALRGRMYFVLNTIATSWFYILTARLAARYSAAVINGWAYLFATGLLGVTGLSLVPPGPRWVLPRNAILPLTWWVLVCSCVGYATIVWAQRHLTASVVSSFPCLQPFISFLAGAVFMGERVQPKDFGAVGIVLGLVLVVTAKPPGKGGND